MRRLPLTHLTHCKLTLIDNWQTLYVAEVRSRMGRAVFRKRLAGIAAIFCWAATSQAASAAKIEHINLGDGIELIAIEGTIASGDEEKFRRLSVQYDDAVVALSSEGGALLAAIEIGKMIRLKEFPTLVLDNYECTSACALIWIAGSTRFLAPGGRVGFHASYRDEGGRKVETGLGNALVGRYLTLLNLPEKAVLFATAAPPDRVLWLSSTNSREAGIDFEVFGKEEDAPPPIVRTNVAPPPVITPNSPALSNLTREWVHVSSGENKKYYLDYGRMYRVGRYIAAWEKGDYSQDPKVRHYEAMSLSYYDCSSRRTALKATTDYDQNGTVLKSYTWTDAELNWNPIVPETVGESKLNYVCRSRL
jgi:hypothetical protein